MTALNNYYLESFEALTNEEEFEIVEFIEENEVDAPTLYRGIYIDSLEEGDCIPLHDVESWASMSPSYEYAYNFGNYVLVVEGLKGIQLHEDEWLVLNTDVNIENIEYDEMNDVYLAYCE